MLLTAPVVFASIEEALASLPGADSFKNGAKAVFVTVMPATGELIFPMAKEDYISHSDFMKDMDAFLKRQR